MEPIRQKVYIETTIPSFYFEVRQEPEMVARRNWTRQWWDSHRQEYELFTSRGVLDELSRGEYSTKNDAINLLSVAAVLPSSEAIGTIVEAYLRHQLMPRQLLGDALHLAMASYHRCEFLLTWNCRHLANGRKFAHIENVNKQLELFVPRIITPMQLLEDFHQ